MQVTRHRFQYSGDDEFKFVGVGDMHWGTKNFDKDKWNRFINWALSEEKLFVVLMGDLAEYISHKDSRRFNPANITPECLLHLEDIINFQAEKVIEMLEPLKGKILGTVIGNHEIDITSHFKDNLYYDICKKLDILKYDLGLGGFIICDFEHTAGGNVKRLVFNVQHTHTTGRKMGGKTNRLIDEMTDYEADIIMRAHSHDRVAVPYTLHRVNRVGQYETKKRLGVITGSFLQTRQAGIDSYADRGGYPTKDTGVVIIHYVPIREDLHVML